MKILTRRQLATIRSKGDEYAQKEELLNALRTCDDALYDPFVEVLENCNMLQIAGLMKKHFIESTPDVPDQSSGASSSAGAAFTQISHPDEDYLKRLRQLYPQLLEKLSAKPVAAQLFAKGVLTVAELQQLILSKTPLEAAEYLLSRLLEMHSEVSYDSFLSALNDTNQHHLFLWLTNEDCDVNCQHADLIREKYDLLVDLISPSDSGLIALLYQYKVIDRREIEYIESGEGNISQTERLLSVMGQKSVDQFQWFLIALDRTGHQHVANQLRHCQPFAESSVAESRVGLDLSQQDFSLLSITGAKSRVYERKDPPAEPDSVRPDSIPSTVASSECCKFSEDLKESLAEIVDADFGLLERLRHVLTDGQYETLSSLKKNDRVEKLMEIVNTLPEEEFRAALQATGQQHVVNFIIKMRSDDGIDDGYLPSMPMSIRQRRAIESTKSWLIKLLNMDELLPSLKESKCITVGHYKFVRKVASVPERTEQLLSILVKRSQADYYTFIEALWSTGQAAAAEAVSIALYGLNRNSTHADDPALIDAMREYLIQVNGVDIKSAGVVDELRKSGVITEHEEFDLNMERSSLLRNELLLRFVERKPLEQKKQCLKVLRTTGQRYLDDIRGLSTPEPTKTLRASGETTFADAFNGIGDYLCCNLDVSIPLLRKCRDAGLIQHVDYEEIQAKPTATGKADELLLRLRKKDDKLLSKFLKALDDSDQKHIAGKIQENIDQQR